MELIWDSHETNKPLKFFLKKNKQTILHIYIGFSVCKQRTKELTVYMVSKSKIGCIIWVTISISSNLQYKNF